MFLFQKQEHVLCSQANNNTATLLQHYLFLFFAYDGTNTRQHQLFESPPRRKRFQHPVSYTKKHPRLTEPRQGHCHCADDCTARSCRANTEPQQLSLSARAGSLPLQHTKPSSQWTDLSAI